MDKTDSKPYHNSTTSAHGQNPSWFQDHLSQNTDEFATMPYNSKKTIMDVIETPKTPTEHLKFVICHYI